MSDNPLIVLFSEELRMRGRTAYALRLARELPQHGFRVLLFAENANRLSREVCQKLHIREVTHLTTPVLQNYVLRVLRAELEDERPVLFHIQDRRLIRAVNWLSSKMKIPNIVTMHGYLNDRENFRTHPQWCKKVIAVSDSVRDDLLERTTLGRDMVCVIRGGVDLEGGIPCGEVMQHERRVVIGTSGALDQIKGVHYFLGAAHEVLQRFPETQFLISGSGMEETSLRQLSRSLGIEENVTIVPSLGDFSAAISAMDVFCLPSLKQGLGTIMLEAMARGRPVIATRTGGVHSVIEDQKTGLIVAPGDVTALADHMIELIERPDWARELGNAGRELVRREYSVARMLEETVSLYRGLLNLPDNQPELVTSSQSAS